MKPQLIDSHAHLAFPELCSDLDRVISDARSSGLKNIINVAIGRNSNEIISAIETARKESFVHHTIGIHPSYADHYSPEEACKIEELIKRERPVAIGETGLDFYRPGYNRDKQMEAFRFHVKLAKKYRLPLVVHQRSSFNEVMEILSSERAFDEIKVVFHCFGGDSLEASSIIDKGGFISITGIVTFKKAARLREVVSGMPIEKLMLESDAPYLAPEPKRGKRNEPAFVIHTAKEIARVTGHPYEEIAARTTENAVEFFGLSY